MRAPAPPADSAVRQACRDGSQPKRGGEGLSAVAEALAAGEHTGQRYWDAELHRLKGTLSIQAETSAGRGTGEWRPGHDRLEQAELRSAAPSPAGVGDAESCFLEAIQVARRQRAKSLELRAAMSLSRRWFGRGKPQEAHGLLAEIYNWFAEGLDTADLREARALLDELERAGSPGRVEKR